MRRAHSIPVLVVLAAGALPARAEQGPERGAKPAAAAAAAADSAEPSEALRQVSLFGGATQVPWRGSQVVLRSALSAVSLDPSAELTYNPYFALTWSFRPWWWFNDKLYVRAQLDVIHELTQPDDTTYAGEALLDDLRLVFGGSGLWTIPRVNVLLSADLVLTLPTSKAARGRTLVLGIGPGARLSRRFGVLRGLVVGYSLRLTPWLHRYATSERATPLIPGCGSETGGCDPYLGTGVRNPFFRLTQMVDASLRLSERLGASLAVGHAVDWLHGIGAAPAAVSLQRVADQRQRFLTLLELEVSYQPLDELELALGYSALHPQLAPDASYYVPFFNRYSMFFVDLRLNVEKVVPRIQRIFR